MIQLFPSAPDGKTHHSLTPVAVATFVLVLVGSCILVEKVPLTAVLALGVLWFSERELPHAIAEGQSNEPLTAALSGALVAGSLAASAMLFVSVDNRNPYPLRVTDYALNFISVRILLLPVLVGVSSSLWKHTQTSVLRFSKRLPLLVVLFVALCAANTIEATLRAQHKPEVTSQLHLQTLPLVGTLPPISETNELPEPAIQERSDLTHREAFSFGSVELIRRSGRWCSFSATHRGSALTSEHSEHISLDRTGRWGLRPNERLNLRRDAQSGVYVLEGRGWPVFIFSQESLEERPLHRRFTHLASAPYQWLPGAWVGLLFSLLYLASARRHRAIVAAEAARWEAISRGNGGTFHDASGRPVHFPMTEPPNFDHVLARMEEQTTNYRTGDARIALQWAPGTLQELEERQRMLELLPYAQALSASAALCAPLLGYMLLRQLCY